jgi:NADPH:quinone reductase-like Zn-dependent oxidoreductase
MDTTDTATTQTQPGPTGSTSQRSAEIRSLVAAEGLLELSIAEVEVRAPGPDEVVVRIDGAPINPSDLGLLFGGADMTTARVEQTDNGPVVLADVPAAAMSAMAARIGQSLPVGNEGGGVVVAAGSSPAAQALLGRTVGIVGGGTYARLRTVHIGLCLAVPDGVTPAQAASCFVNPLTALGMVGTMRRDGHTALVHTAAASNLGQMLVKVCLADGIPLVNIVRRSEQADLLRSLGAVYVCDSSSDTFTEDLTAALVATGATIAFDATGGGTLASRILSAMEASAVASSSGYSRYGSTTHKQVYIYGGLDRSPTVLNRTFGMAWSIGGWLLTPYLGSIGADEAQAMRDRVAAEITTTFASHYDREVTLAGALSLEAIAAYGRQATGQKHLITPNA